MRALALAIVFTSSTALADAGSANDVDTLLKQLDTEHAALSTSDCTAACRAVASIRRAAEKICTLEPGPRCEAARSKAADATRRVREACPDCVIPGAAEPERASTPTSTPAHEESYKTANAPERGGCRSCNGAGANPGDLGVVLLGLAAVARLTRRRRG
jgi:hypothetical protein